jgi:hypothetical protein
VRWVRSGSGAETERVAENLKAVISSGRSATIAAVRQWRKSRRASGSRQLLSGEELRVEVSPYRAQHYISLRRWYLADDGEYRPGKGLSVHVVHVPFLRAALERAEAEMLAAGLLDEVAYESVGLPLPAELLTRSA